MRAERHSNLSPLDPCSSLSSSRLTTFFIVSGTGTLRYGSETRKVRAGDIICCPVGGPETAHQLVNDSDEDLRFLSISTMTDPEVCEYPDSGKIIAYDGKWRHSTESASGNVDYWKGEI